MIKVMKNRVTLKLLKTTTVFKVCGLGRPPARRLPHGFALPGWRKPRRAVALTSIVSIRFFVKDIVAAVIINWI